MKIKKLLVKSLIGIALCIGLFSIGSAFSQASVYAKPVYDISQWQGNITNAQGHRLHHEVAFTILKAENGGIYQDPTFSHNASVMHNNHIPYGAYDYAMYKNGTQAREEASSLVNRAPHAKFYVNDLETFRDKSNINGDTQDWAISAHHHTHKPVVLYSYAAFLKDLSPATRKAYDAIWIASYGSRPAVGFHYDLWQYTDHHHSNALGKNLDASVIPSGGKPVSFWTRGHARHHSNHYVGKIGESRTYHKHAFNLKYRQNQMKWFHVAKGHTIRMYTKHHTYIGPVAGGNLIPVDHFIHRHHKLVGVLYRANSRVTFTIHHHELVR